MTQPLMPAILVPFANGKALPIQIEVQTGHSPPPNDLHEHAPIVVFGNDPATQIKIKLIRGQLVDFTP